LTAEDLRAYHQRIMQTSRLLLVIVGDLDPAMLKARIAASFGKLPRAITRRNSLRNFPLQHPQSR